MKLLKNVESIIKTQDYSKKPSIDGVTIIPLKRFNDDSGSLTELSRFVDGRVKNLQEFKLAQINYSEMEACAIKAFHVHKMQTDIWYVPPSDKILLVLADLREDSKTAGVKMRIVLGDANSRLIVVPPGIAHGCKNLLIRASRIIYFVDKEFSCEPEKCDEWRLPWDYFGEEIWEIEKG